ncbi:hypothetical protein QTH90_31150 [Variovorax sp. J2P1-59]|uniref:hypothetical protein n=1 Tax=Variovorax flavidus TaxID=3053501 RepID=UPI002575F3C8|nr:hypothetical protein [Variovorax sp. J2P1-59]MDM0078899.1 hypothetical protein [Variovorax sp. J2P1-59]
MNSRFFLLFAPMMLAACSSLDRTDEIGRQPLQVGIATKADVVNSIGLPRKTEVDQKTGQEIWYYTGKPVSRRYFIPMPVAATNISPSLQMVHFADIGPKGVPQGESVVLTTIFDASGLMIFVKRSEDKK